MKRSKIKCEDIKQRLFERFESDLRDFLETRQRCKSEINNALAELQNNYPADLVDEAVSQFDTLSSTTIIERPAEPSPETLIADQVVVEPISIKKTPRKRRRRAVRNAVSFADLKQHVLEAVRSFGKASFTILDVKRVLSAKDLEFQPNHLHILLPKYFSGIKVSGKQKRPGIALNVYKATGNVNLLVTKTRRSKLTFSELKDKVIGIVSGFESDFTIKDVAKTLKGAGFRFKQNYLRVILCKYIGGIKKIDERDRMNVYVVAGTVCARTKK